MEIAHCWYNYLTELSGDGKNPEKINSLKEDLSNVTLVGEYIGNPTHQHMVLYNRETLIFYGVVSNYSDMLCWPIDKALSLFKKHHLDVVIVQSLGLYSTYDALCDGLYKAFRDVAKGKIVEEEEGSVVYLTHRDKSGDKSLDRVLSMAKLKTIEYRIFRKMREKLRGYYNNEVKTGKAGDSSLIIKKFNKEMKEILEGNETPKPIEYYTGILEGAFRFI
jgi:hypothetical protein